MTGPATVTRQSGIAVVTAMLVVALATLLAVELVWNQHLDMRRTESALSYEQARQYALGAETWAADVLREDQLADGPGGQDHLGEIWAFDLPPLPVDGGSINGTVADQQGRFNLNNLVDGSGRAEPVALGQFRRLLLVLELDPGLAEAVIDWIDPDQQPGFPGGAEDDAYTGLDPAYRTGNTWLTSTSELRAMQGFTPEILQVILPHVAALPVGDGPTRINVNTATPALLAALDESVSLPDVERWIEDRQAEGFGTLEQFEAFDPAVQQTLGTASRYFGATVTVSIGRSRLTMYSLLERGVIGPESRVTARVRNFGYF